MRKTNTFSEYLSSSSCFTSKSRNMRTAFLRISRPPARAWLTYNKQDEIHSKKIIEIKAHIKQQLLYE